MSFVTGIDYGIALLICELHHMVLLWCVAAMCGSCSYHPKYRIAGKFGRHYILANWLFWNIDDFKIGDSLTAHSARPSYLQASLDTIRWRRIGTYSRDWKHQGPFAVVLVHHSTVVRHVPRQYQPHVPCS